MLIAIPKEITSNELRVALIPSLVQDLLRLGCTVGIEKNAGLAAFYPDDEYHDVQIYADSAQLYNDADIILKVVAPTIDEISAIKNNAIIISFFYPARFPDRVQILCDRNITSFAMELIPRISRAQSMDALSSQATVAGYKSVLIAANLLNRFFPMLTTAAGTIKPSNVLVIGAGVAGLQAIATSRRLGAVVKAYDIRSTTKEQVESLGAKMVNIDIQAEGTGGYARQLTEDEQQKQQIALKDAVAKSDIIICTALIPGKPAPKIITQEMVDAMSPGSVIVDIAAEAGGNCELTQPEQTINYRNIIIDGPVNLPSMLARDASNMYAKNMINFLNLMFKDNKLDIDWSDPILAESVVTHEGDIKYKMK